MQKRLINLLEIVTLVGLAFLFVSIHQGTYNIEEWTKMEGYTLFGTSFWLIVLYYIFIKD